MWEIFKNISAYVMVFSMIVTALMLIIPLLWKFSEPWIHVIFCGNCIHYKGK